MATTEENKRIWDTVYNWKGGGEEWSMPWGGTDMEWYFTILPRIHSFVPAQTILEIAPGYGRWSQFLAGLCHNLILVDLSEKCIEACRDRFKPYSHIKYFVNDGGSLEMIPDGSVDFMFSFDSLVHVEDKVIEKYLSQVSRKLKKSGGGFIHHSNVGQNKVYYFFVNRMPNIVKLALSALNRWRGYSMSAEKFRTYAKNAGLHCVSQEIINWANDKRLIDCLSVFKKDEVSECQTPVILRNKGFKNSVKQIHQLSRLYKNRL